MRGSIDYALFSHQIEQSNMGAPVIKNATSLDACFYSGMLVILIGKITQNVVTGKTPSTHIPDLIIVQVPE